MLFDIWNPRKMKLNRIIDTTLKLEWERFILCQCNHFSLQDGICQYTSSLGKVGDTGYKDIESGSEDALLNAVATVGPISVAMDASHLSFQVYTEALFAFVLIFCFLTQMYDSGIYSEPECSSEKLDHGVLAVGYGEMSTGEYWIVKNR